MSDSYIIKYGEEEGWGVYIGDEIDQSLSFLLTMHNTYEDGFIEAKSVIGFDDRHSLHKWFEDTTKQKFAIACEIHKEEDDYVYVKGGRVGYSFVNFYNDEGQIFSLQASAIDGIGEDYE